MSSTANPSDNQSDPPSTGTRGLLLVLSSPSGAGKTTLAHRLLDEFPATSFSVSYTTRGPRKNERDGVDYHFVDADEFQQGALRVSARYDTGRVDFFAGREADAFHAESVFLLVDQYMVDF